MGHQRCLLLVMLLFYLHELAQYGVSHQLGEDVGLLGGLFYLCRASFLFLFLGYFLENGLFEDLAELGSDDFAVLFCSH